MTSGRTPGESTSTNVEATDAGFLTYEHSGAPADVVYQERHDDVQLGLIARRQLR